MLLPICWNNLQPCASTYEFPASLSGNGPMISTADTCMGYLAWMVCIGALVLASVLSCCLHQYVASGELPCPLLVGIIVLNMYRTRLTCVLPTVPIKVLPAWCFIRINNLQITVSVVEQSYCRAWRLFWAVSFDMYGCVWMWSTQTHTHSHFVSFFRAHTHTHTHTLSLALYRVRF